MSVTQINHAEVAASRLTGLYRDKPKWCALVAMLAGMWDDIAAAAADVARLDDVDAKRDDGSYFVGGVNLDVLGARVGQSRRASGAIPLIYFGWDDDDDAYGWGEDDDELSGGRWYEDGLPLTADAIMDDSTFRVAIRMRVLKNSTKDLNLETIIAALLHIFPDAPSIGTYALVLYEVAGAVLFGIGRKPTDLEVTLLRYTGAFPKPGGISVGSFYWVYGEPTFAFDDDPDTVSAAGWGDDEDGGGTFAEEF